MVEIPGLVSQLNAYSLEVFNPCYEIFRLKADDVSSMLYEKHQKRWEYE